MHKRQIPHLHLVGLRRYSFLPWIMTWKTATGQLQTQIARHEKTVARSLLRQTRSLVTHSSARIGRSLDPCRYYFYYNISSISKATSLSSSNISIRSISVLSNNVFAPQKHVRPNCPHLPVQYHQKRHASTSSSWLPEAFSSFSIWGGSGWMLNTLHFDGLIPYWACFAIINILVRLALFPLVIQGAHASARFAKVVPEVQFLISLFTNDLKAYQKRKASYMERWALMSMNFKTLGGIYKLHNINPFAVFLSPLLQIPIFMYLSVDLRKIVNGLDPQLAQALVESPVAWIPDLTEPDPWYGLPVLAGLLLYANVEVAVGKRSLAGPSTAKADTGVLLKDIFQSFAVFMPCFTSQMPAGVQIYVATSFLFTMGQSAALRNAAFRSMVGLPPMVVPGEGSNEPPKYAQQMIRLKQLEQKAREIRGDGPLLGKGILAHGFECSFPGTYRESTIQVDRSGLPSVQVDSKLPSEQPLPAGFDGGASKAHLDISSSPFVKLPYIHGVSAPPWQIAEQQHLFQPPTTKPDKPEAIPDFSDEVMAKANRGEMPVATRMVDASTPNANAKPRKPLRVNRKIKKGGSKKSKR